jgi:hypothetical protein
VLLAGFMLAVRLCVALLAPELESDAYGHLFIAKAVVRRPGNLHVHWVWLPGWHWVLATVAWHEHAHQIARSALSVLQLAGPLLVYSVARREIALLAAALYTLAQLPNLLATSAQPETLFALLTLGATLGLERRRGLVAGACLAGAALLRYEAWGSVALVAAGALFASKQDRKLWLQAALPPLFAIATWLAARHLSGADWLGFARHTHGFVERYRAASGRSALTDALLTLALPCVALGPTVLLLPFGDWKTIPKSWLVPGGIALFLVASALNGSALPLPRYFTALTPFGCILVAEGALWLARSRQKPFVVPASLLAMAATTTAHLAHALFKVS